MAQFSQLQAATEAQKQSDFEALAGEIQQATQRLHEEVAGMSGIFRKVLRPEEPRPTGEGKNVPNTRSHLENWLLEQLAIVVNCTQMLIDYRSRCCL